MRFSGRAGQGTLGGSGTIGLTPPMPIALTFTADDATLLASPLINATLDSHMTVKGDVDGNLAVGGTIHMRQANVQVPDKLPPSVAVLPVRVRGPGDACPGASAAPAAPSAAPSAGQAAPPRTIALDITLDALQQVFIRGRGLDVELGGTVRVGGTVARPLPSGRTEFAAAVP